jgi:hypothetical protein
MVTTEGISTVVSDLAFLNAYSSIRVTFGKDAVVNFESSNALLFISLASGKLSIPEILEQF